MNAPAAELATRDNLIRDLQEQIDVMHSILKSYKLGEYYYDQAKVDARKRRVRNLQARQRRLKQKNELLRQILAAANE